MRLGKKQLALTLAAVSSYEPKTEGERKVKASVLALLSPSASGGEGEVESVKRDAPGVAPAKLEAALTEASCGKVISVPMATPSYWAKVYRRAKAINATEEQASLIGLWMANEGWISPGGFTLSSVLYKWEDYLAKARAKYPDGAGSGGSSRTPAW